MSWFVSAESILAEHHYDFFSLGAKTSATGAATYLTLFTGVIFYMVMESNSVKKDCGHSVNSDCFRI